MRLRLHRLLHLAAALLIAASAVAGVAAVDVAPARAVNAVLEAGNRLGGVTLTPSSGTISIDGRPQRLTTATACPDGFRDISRVFFIWEDGTLGDAHAASLLTRNSSSAPAGSGLEGEAVDRQGDAAADWGRVGGFTLEKFAGHDGLARYVVTCEVASLYDVVTGAPRPSDTASLLQNQNTWRYFSVDIAIDYGDGSNPTWQVVADAAQPASDQSQSDLNVTVPDVAPIGSATGLKITIAPAGSILSGGPRAAGLPWIATGELGAVTVTDDRRDSAAAEWTLSGQVGDFISASGLAFPASALAWTPRAASGYGIAGPSSQDLSAPSILATGPATADADADTTVNADFTLTVPQDTVAGDYAAVLTLILI